MSHNVINVSMTLKVDVLQNLIRMGLRMNE